MMKITNETRSTLKWDTKFGQFEAIVCEGKITSVRCVHGRGDIDPQGEGFALWNPDPEFLTAVRDAIDDLLKFLKENEG